ncbi:unnamed protein product, partial [Discosporangium mesarthrocarpum]
CLVLPKYHCELNPMEMVWRRSKCFVWRHCKYTIQGMRKNIPFSL